MLQAERYYRRKLVLHAADMHQALLSDVASSEELRGVWTPPKEELAPTQYAQLVHCNRQIALLSAKFRVGLLDRRTLRVQARWLMEHDIARNYWQRYGAFRELEAQDRTDRLFNSILDDEFTAAADPDTVAA
jgi:hypothetical protein